MKRKNRVIFCIESCKQCPSATLKFEEFCGDIMFCQTEDGCIQLREGWGDRPIPDWCPRLKPNSTDTEK